MSASPTSLMGVGIPDKAANKLGNTIATLAGVGTAQSGAKNLTVNCALLTTSGGQTAFVLPTTWEVGDTVTVFNTSATTALIFPQTGGAINGGSTNASISVAQNTGVQLLKVSATAWRAIASSASISGSFTTLSVSSTAAIDGAATFGSSVKSTSATGGVGYATGAGGAVTQGTNRTTGVEVNAICGAITLVSAAGSTSPAAFTVTNSAVAATDVIILSQKSGTDRYRLAVTAVGDGSFEITFNTISGTTTEQPVFNFAVIKAVAA